MERKITIDEYFRLPETNRPMELVYGYVREPPAPFYDHQRLVVRLLTLLDSHVRDRGLGTLCVSPLDVVLDRELHLVVQPDLLFISKERESIIHQRIWGAPDLVVEIASPSTEHRDRTLKLAWYRRYGVKECWLVFPSHRRIEVVDCSNDQRASFTGSTPLRSHVLPGLDAEARTFFEV
jgi:Uma2 family endonuclease